MLAVTKRPTSAHSSTVGRAMRRSPAKFMHVPRRDTPPPLSRTGSSEEVKKTSIAHFDDVPRAGERRPFVTTISRKIDGDNVRIVQSLLIVAIVERLLRVDETRSSSRSFTYASPSITSSRLHARVYAANLGRYVRYAVNKGWRARFDRGRRNAVVEGRRGGESRWREGGGGWRLRR